MNPFRQARARAFGKAIALFVTMLMVVNLTPVLAQTGPSPIKTTIFSNGEAFAQVNLTPLNTNTSAGVSLFKKSKIDQASIKLEARGIDYSKTFEMNNDADFNAKKTVNLETEASDGSVHLMPKTRALTLSTDADFQGGDSMNMVSDFGVHLASGSGTWEQQTFSEGPGIPLDSSGTGFDTYNNLDWTTGDGALRLKYYYTYSTSNTYGTNKPGVRAGMAYASDPSTGNLYISAGWVAGSIKQDTYKISIENNSWSKICDPCTNMMMYPYPPISNASMDYNTDTKSIEVSGGEFGNNVEVLTRSWATTNMMPFWNNMSDLPSPRTRQSEIYDEDTHKSIIFGGMDNNLNPTSTVFYKGNDTLWKDVTPTSYRPAPRYGHSAVWDPAAKRMYIFGGAAGSPNYFNDLHSYDPSNNTFIELAAMSPVKPTKRAYQGAMWDPTGNAMIILGGRDDTKVISDIWAYFPVNDTWVKLPFVTTGEDTRWSMASAWNAVKRQGTVWGGANTFSGSPASDDVINLNGQYWTTGNMTSSVIDIGATATWKTMNIRTKGIYGANPLGTLKLMVRTGQTNDPSDPSWSSWLPVNINASLDAQGIPPSEFMQYRLLLNSFYFGETPIVYDLSFNFDITATSGYLTTHEFDLRETPLYYTGLTTMIYDIPSITRTSISIEYRDDATLPYSTIVFTDNESLATMPTGRYVRFNISMTSSLQSVSPYLISLSLGFVVAPPLGIFQMTFVLDRMDIFWFLADWNTTDTRPGMGKGTASISVFVGDKFLDLPKGTRADLPKSPFSPSKLILNITLKTDGHSDPRLTTLRLQIGGGSFPSEIALDVGNDGTEELNWQGKQLLGNTTSAPFLKTAIQNYLDSPQAVPDGSGLVVVPLALRSKTSGLIVLKDLIVSGSIANVPPVINSKPPLTAQAGVDYRYTVMVDNKGPKDLNFSVLLGPKGMLFSGNNLLWTPDKTPQIFIDVTIGVSDGIDMTKQSWTITVDNNGTGHLPVFKTWPANYQPSTGTVPMRFGDTFFYQLEVIDEDAGDIVILSIEQGPKGMSLLSKDLKWKPSDLDVGNFTVILRAYDGKGSTYQTFRIIVGPNKAPTIDKTIPQLKVKVGKNLNYKVLASDKDLDTIQYSLEGAPAWLSIDNQGTISGRPGSKDAGIKNFKVMVSDGHLNSTAAVTVNVAKASVVGGIANDDLLALLLIILILCIIVIVVAFVVVRSRKKRSKAAKLEADLAAPQPAAPVHHAPSVALVHHQPNAQTPSARSYPERVSQTAPLAPAAAVEAPLPEPTVPMAEPVKEEKPVIEEIYLIYNDGRLIAHESSKGGMVMDEHVLSGMLKAIQEFVKDSFQKEGALGGLDYGDSRIMLESGNCATFAIVLKGKETKALREETRRALERIEGLYSGVIECWDGEASHFGDVKKYFGPIFALGKTQEEQAEAGEVKVLSALEFYQGYVRLKAAVKNTYPFMVYEVTLKILYDKKALQLTYIEPEYEREGSEVTIGNIPPNEKKTVAFYLDPLICMESSIDATALFKNYKGELKTVLMKRRPVDIVCPIFYTEQNVNVAMLKRLITELKYKDSKIYTIPKSMLPSQAMDLAKAVISARDVKFVREFLEETPYLAEAWFYGKTKHTLEDLVIRATMREENGFLEIYVCSNNLATLPGLLADLGHGIKKRYMDLKKTKEGLTQVTDVKVKDELEKSRMLIDKYVSTEAEAHSDENEL